MDYKMNISYRRSIEKKVFQSQKLTDVEKWWLLSNPRFNEQFDFPCYQRDVISIPENRETAIVITALSFGDDTKTYRPVISVVGKGWIQVENELYNMHGEKSSHKQTRMLVTLLNPSCTSTLVKVNSKSGLISIAYQCEYYDERRGVYMREVSDGANLSYAMKKQEISDNEYVYLCKNPSVHDAIFESFSFLIKVSSC